VVALGEGVQGWKIGDELCALVAGGGYAEYVAAPALQCLPMPNGLSKTQAGGVPETFFTVWTNVFQRGRLQSGESFLVHGGSSGIGVTAIQLAKAFGARVFATAGNDEKCRACQELGADPAINYKTEDFVAVVKEATGGKGVDLILDMVGGDYVPRNIEALAIEGRAVSIATLGGSSTTINVTRMMMKRLTLTGSTLRPRSVEQKGAIARELREQVWPLFEQGRIKVPVHASFPLAEAAQAHALMESSTHIGKIVLTVRD
jgi:putative PIG3 family NAD(P)H quinone oxidoreductase